MAPKDRSVKPGFAVLLAGYLNERMISRGLNQTQLAEAAEVDQPMLSRTLKATRNVTADELDRIARVLGTDPTAVMDIVRNRQKEGRHDPGVRPAGPPPSASR